MTSQPSSFAPGFDPELHTWYLLLRRSPCWSSTTSRLEMRHRLQSSKQSGRPTSSVSYPKYKSMLYWRNQILPSEEDNNDQCMSSEDWNQLSDEVQKAKISIEVNHSEFLKSLLEQRDAVNLQSVTKQTMLHLAVLKGDLTKAALLLQHKAGECTAHEFIVS